jgi:hypothetical protein
MITRTEIESEQKRRSAIDHARSVLGLKYLNAPDEAIERILNFIDLLAGVAVQEYKRGRLIVKGKQICLT